MANVGSANYRNVGRSVELEVVAKELGYKELRQNQEAAIRNFLLTIPHVLMSQWLPSNTILCPIHSFTLSIPPSNIEI